MNTIEQYPLPDDLYDSKDWRDGGYAERVEWLHTMYENVKHTLDAYVAQQQEPIAYLAWRDGKPCWEGDDCVCEDPVYPVDGDDDRTSMPVYLSQPQRKPLTDEEIMSLCAAEWASHPIEVARVIEAAHGIK